MYYFSINCFQFKKSDAYPNPGSFLPAENSHMTDGPDSALGGENILYGNDFQFYLQLTSFRIFLLSSSSRNCHPFSMMTNKWFV